LKFNVYMTKDYIVIKEGGEKEPFKKGKFCGSLKEVGVPNVLVDEICNVVVEDLRPGITTSQIFRNASRYLMKKNKNAAMRYSLKRGISELGPAGFIFEQFVETVLSSLGYKTKRNVILRGECVSHEVDVLAKREEEHMLVEAKYHNSMGTKTALDVLMYAGARLDDIVKVSNKLENKRNIHGMWLITNTKFTHTAIKYGICKGIRMTGWNYPKKEGLEDVIREHALYPVTVLPSVDKRIRGKLAEVNLMLASDLAPYSAKSLRKYINIDTKKAQEIISEAHILVYGK
jgi:hypothetical protein